MRIKGKGVKENNKRRQANKRREGVKGLPSTGSLHKIGIASTQKKGGWRKEKKEKKSWDTIVMA